MTFNNQYRILGGPGSPYSFKLRAVLRYRHIPHVWEVPQGPAYSNSDLLNASKRVIPVLQFPDGAFRADTTPLIHELEESHPDHRSVFPPDPGQCFLANLIEEFADEWLILAMADYRWNLAEDIAFCAKKQISGWMRSCPHERLDDVVEKFTKRQTAVREAACGPDQNRPVYQQTYQQLLQITEALNESSLFLFGSRPSIADFGLFGPLFQLAIDPTPSAIMRKTALRTYAWVQLMDDASGIDGEWAPADEPKRAVESLLRLTAETLLPLVSAIQEGYQRQAESIELTILGKPFVLRLPYMEQHQIPTGPLYKIRSLGWLKADLMKLQGEPRNRTEKILEETGCRHYLDFQPGEADQLTSRRSV